MFETEFRTGTALGTGTAFRGAVLAAAFVTASFQAVEAQQDQGFLFGAPKASLTLRVGYSVPRAGSDLFDFTRNQLTVDQDDFNGAAVAGELGVRMTERVDFTMGLGYAGSVTRSEFRDWVDADNLPIEQQTEFDMVPFTAGFKAYLGQRGRSIGRLAWVPQSQINPYVGVGAGVTWYRFEQFGDFIDSETLDIFSDNLLSDGFAPTIQVMGGLDLTLTPRVYFTGEARYGWANAPLGGDFVGFDDLDLAGLQASAGIGFRF